MSALSTKDGHSGLTDETLSSVSVLNSQELPHSISTDLLIVYQPGQEAFVQTVGSVMSRDCVLITKRQAMSTEHPQTIFGITVQKFLAQWVTRDSERLTIVAHDIDTGLENGGDQLTELCHHEYLYRQSFLDRRDLTRFLSFVTNQSCPHEHLIRKERTTLISTTFADIATALPNLEILSVGADSVELRVDLLQEPLPGGSSNAMPSLKYVGEQVMLLRQRTELPIIYTARCTNENGRFPMGDPSVVHHYLYKAIQWGCEYIDVELWLPEDIRKDLARKKGVSKIISAFHSFSGDFKWTSSEAREKFASGALYSDIVKMNVLVSSVQANYELEAFRSSIQTEFTKPLFSGLNMGASGQISRSFNKVFTPITHPLLPMVAAPGQLSAAEINQSLHIIGELPKLDIYGIETPYTESRTPFFEKCFNELSLPHKLISLERLPDLGAILKDKQFGGAYFDPPRTVKNGDAIQLSAAAKEIGLIDTITVHTTGLKRSIVGDNATWKGIQATLVRQFVPTAYHGRAALLLANTAYDASPAIHALHCLRVNPIYTIGFELNGSLAQELTPIASIEHLTDLGCPFAVINALPEGKSLIVASLLKHYSSGVGQKESRIGKIFLDLSEGSKKGDLVAIAASLGWTTSRLEDVRSWTTMEMIRMLVGQNVPFDFVRLTCGRISY